MDKYVFKITTEKCVNCESLLRFKRKFDMNIPDFNQEVFIFMPNDDKSCMLPLFLGNRLMFDHCCAIFQNVKKTFLQEICNSFSLHILELNNTARVLKL